MHLIVLLDIKKIKYVWPIGCTTTQKYPNTNNVVTEYSFTVFEGSTEPLWLRLNCNLTCSKEVVRLIILEQLLCTFIVFQIQKKKKRDCLLLPHFCKTTNQNSLQDWVLQSPMSILIYKCTKKQIYKYLVKWHSFLSPVYNFCI